MYPIIKVKWLDSASEYGWKPIQNGIGNINLECESVGYLVFEDDLEIVIIQSLNDYQISDLLHIPKVVILSREILSICPILTD